MKENFFVQLINIEDVEDIQRTANDYDIIGIKATWGDKTEKYIREKITDHDNKYMIFFVSGSNPPSSVKQLYFYDLIFYETDWYKKFISMHPLIIKAFGVNYNKFSSSSKNQTYDYIMYGELKLYKNYHEICKKRGNRLVIGDYSSADGLLIKEILNYFGVTVLPYMEFSKILKYLNDSKVLLIPTFYFGGGERVLLETKYSTDIEIEFNRHNKKLIELNNQNKILDHIHYKEQIENGLNQLINLKGKQ